MKDLYDGIAVLDAAGEAAIILPDYFQALNKDFRYLLTPIGSPAPGLFIKTQIADNRFTIAGGRPGQKVSWQVSGIRHDAAAKYPPPIEEDKGPNSSCPKGKYINPEAFGLDRDEYGLFGHKKTTTTAPAEPPQAK